MATGKVRKGDQIQARVHHNGVKSGTVGKVTGVYSGTYYAVNYPGVQGVCYTPDPHATPVTGPGAAPAAAPGISSPALSAAQEHIETVGIWSRLMSMLGASPAESSSS
jgi:hypothetical protein